MFKQRLSRRMRGKKRAGKGQLALRVPGEDGGLRRFWQRRCHDFNVYSRAKVQEKLHYVHANPVKEKLVRHSGGRPWSSWSYWYRGEGLLKMDAWTGDSRGKAEAEKEGKAEEEPTLCKNRKG